MNKRTKKQFNRPVDTEKRTEAPKKVEQMNQYSFPEYGRTITAPSKEEAIKILKGGE